MLSYIFIHIHKYGHGFIIIVYRKSYPLLARIILNLKDNSPLYSGFECKYSHSEKLYRRLNTKHLLYEFDISSVQIATASIRSQKTLSR